MRQKTVYFSFVREWHWSRTTVQCRLENLCSRTNLTLYDVKALDRLIDGNPAKSYESEKRGTTGEISPIFV